MQRLVSLLFGLSIAVYAGNPKRDISAGYFYNVIPQVATGGGWKTTFMIANLEKAKAVTWSLKFFDPAGKPLQVSTLNQGRGSVIGGVLQTNGSVTVETEDSGTLIQGWALLESSGTDDIGAVVIFRSRSPGRPDYEAVVPVSEDTDYDFVMPFDNSSGFVTSLAWVNAGTFSDVTFDLDVFDESGIKIDTQKVTLKPGQRDAFELASKFPATAGRRGTISPSGNTFFRLTTLGLRFNSGGAFTSLHTLSR